MYANSLMMFFTANFFATIQKHKFYQNRPKIKLFLQKKYKTFERWAPPHTPRTAPLQIFGSESNHVFAHFYATRILPDATF